MRPEAHACWRHAGATRLILLLELKNASVTHASSTRAWEPDEQPTAAPPAPRGSMLRPQLLLLSTLLLGSFFACGAAAASADAQPGRACEESGYCSVGVSRPWTGDVRDSAKFREMLAAVAFKQELIITIYMRQSDAVTIWEDQVRRPPTGARASWGWCRAGHTHCCLHALLPRRLCSCTPS